MHTITHVQRTRSIEVIEPSLCAQKARDNDAHYFMNETIGVVDARDGNVLAKGVHS